MKKQRRNSEISADSFQCKYAEIQTYFKQPVDVAFVVLSNAQKLGQVQTYFEEEVLVAQL